MNSELYWKFMMLSYEEREEILLVVECFNRMATQHPGWRPERIEKVITGRLSAETEDTTDYAALSHN